MRKRHIFVSILFITACIFTIAKCVTAEEPALIGDDVLFRVVPGQEEIAPQDRQLIMSRVKETPVTLAEMLDMLEATKIRIEQLVIFYHVTLQTILRIHEDSELPNLDKIPPNVSVYFHIPLVSEISIKELD